MSMQKPQSGFTLIEVMVALAIVAIALAALSRSMGVTISNQSQLETRIVATWVAENELIKMQVLGANQIDRQSEIEMMDRSWKSQIRTETTTFPGIQKAVIEVSLPNEKKPVVRLVTVVGS